MPRPEGMKSGGYLIIDQAEALTAIDVNSGRFVGSSSLEDTTTQCNLEAVDEIAHQLRLRNIGGLIVLDFIDMEKVLKPRPSQQGTREGGQEGPCPTNVLKISELGLVEMTRKRVQETWFDPSPSLLVLR